MRSLICVFILLAFSSAHALFLAGQTEPGGVISILCEGEKQVFLSLPSGESRAVSLDSDFQAKVIPISSGPYTFQCGKETATIKVSLPKPEDSGAYSGGENLFLVSVVAIVFLAAFFLAAKFLLKPCTIFSKSIDNGHAILFLRAGEDLREIKIIDNQGGEDGAPLHLSLPILTAGAEWRWEYECDDSAPLIAAHLSAKCANGVLSIISEGAGGSVPNQKKGMHEKRKLAKHQSKSY